ncbi:MAG: hypothetical protein Q8Q47_08390 [Ignavibacteriaceae bacterium]|nr:hypothetical protein [Ignavibacteriaceae bacterium]
MKTYITIIISILFISTCFAQKDLLPAFPREINIQDGIAYFNGSPFTGLLFDEKTNKRIGEYKNGYKNGFFTEYHKNGIKKNECNYILGRRDGIFKDWFENGNKWSEIAYKNGLKDGTCTEWFENSQQKVSYVYKDGYLLDGTYITFLENGQKESQTTYKDEQIILSGKYENGEFIVLLELSIELYPNLDKPEPKRKKSVNLGYENINGNLQRKNKLNAFLL